MMNCLPCLPHVYKGGNRAASIVVPVNHMDEATLQAAPAPIKMKKEPLVQAPVETEKPPSQVFPAPVEEQPSLQVLTVPVQMEQPPAVQDVQAPEETKPKMPCPAAPKRRVRFADEEGKKDAVRVTVLMTKKEAEQLMSILDGGGSTLEDLVSRFKAGKRCARAPAEPEGCRNEPPEIVSS